MNVESNITEVLNKLIEESGSDENKLALESLLAEIKSQIEKIRGLKLRKILY